MILMSGDLVRRRRENMRRQLGKLVRDQESPLNRRGATEVNTGPGRWRSPVSPAQAGLTGLTVRRETVNSELQQLPGDQALHLARAGHHDHHG